MNALERKMELISRLQSLGFYFGEACALRRIEMTLQRWGERECGDAQGRCIERDDETGKPFATYETGTGKRGRYAVADREAGALRRLAAIVAARNGRAVARHMANGGHLGDKLPGFVIPYHQGDCRGCNLYLVTRAQLMDQGDKLLPLDQYYTRGLAVCA